MEAEGRGRGRYSVIVVLAAALGVGRDAASETLRRRDIDRSMFGRLVWHTK